jgi:hypothetical protein
VISEERERWLEAGSPPVPTLVIDGIPHVLQHPSQAAVLLGLEAPPQLRDARRVAWDIDSLMAAWVELCTDTPWDVLTAPIPGFGRTPLALAVDASVGIQALRDPFASGLFHWPGNPETGETGDQNLYDDFLNTFSNQIPDLIEFQLVHVARVWNLPVYPVFGWHPWTGISAAHSYHIVEKHVFGDIF